jgi:hypothetical protein
MRIAQEINYLSALSGIPCSDFKHVLIEQLSVLNQNASFPSEVLLIDYTVPASYGLIATRLFIRGAITATTTAESTRRADETFFPFTTRIYFRRNGSLIFRDHADEHLVGNKDFLLPLSSGDRLEVALFNPSGIAADVSAVLNGYYVPDVAITAFQRNATAFITLNS